LVALLNELGEFDPPLIVLGGLVPDLLTRDQDVPAPQHLGTTDVDILIDFQVAADQDLGPIEDALEKLGFSPAPGVAGWRWVGRIGGGCRRLTAVNLRGTGYVREDWRVEEIADRFGAADRIGAAGYAAQALLADPTADEARLRQDATAAVSEFLDALGVL